MQGIYNELSGKILAGSDGLFYMSVHRLKSGKSDESGLYSNHVQNGPHKLFVLLTCLFNAMLVHGSALRIC